MKNRRLIEKLAKIFSKKYKLDDIFVGKTARYMGYNETHKFFATIEQVVFFVVCEEMPFDEYSGDLVVDIFTSEKMYTGTIGKARNLQPFCKVCFEIIQKNGWTDKTRLTLRQLKEIKIELENINSVTGEIYGKKIDWKNNKTV